MRLSATLTLGSAALLALVVTAGVTQPIAFIASIPLTGPMTGGGIFGRCLPCRE